ncbi:MAG: 4Fe-4S dicluster domain-containing protein, partial [Sphingomonadales bacterium]
ITGTAPFTAYASVAVLTFTTFTLGGFMHEQVCIYMCPWPRIQSAMLDEKSLLVTYRDWRGEPRTSGMKKTAVAGLPAGDCIDCGQCAAVCPTGIDIRSGPQLGCITCGLCVDACNKVMGQIGKPLGLIDYVTLEDARREQAGGQHRPAWQALLRPRTLIYGSVWAAIGLAMLFTLGNRSRLAIDAAQDRAPIAITLSDGMVRNGWTLKFRNMESRPRTVRLALAGLPGAQMWSDASSRAAAGTSMQVRLAPDATTRLHLYVAAPVAAPGTTDFRLAATPLDATPGSREARVAVRQLTFERPA